MSTLLLTKTNEKIRGKLSALSQYKHLFENSKYPYLKEINAEEVKVFIGLIFYHGLYNQNNQSIKNLISC